MRPRSASHSQETQALAELFFHIRKDDVAKVQAVVKKEKIKCAPWPGRCLASTCRAVNRPPDEHSRVRPSQPSQQPDGRLGGEDTFARCRLVQR